MNFFCCLDFTGFNNILLSSVPSLFGRSSILSGPLSESNSSLSLIFSHLAFVRSTDISSKGSWAGLCLTSQFKASNTFSHGTIRSFDTSFLQSTVSIIIGNSFGCLLLSLSKKSASLYTWYSVKLF